MNVALSYEAMGRPEEAETFLLDYLKKGFEDSQFYFMLGNLNFIRKDYDKAIPYFEKCISLKAESAGSYNLLARSTSSRTTLRGPSHASRKAAEINPDLANIHFNRAQIDEKRGDNRSAQAEYLKELEVSPDHFKALYNLSRLYRAEGDEAKEYDVLKQLPCHRRELPADLFLPGPDLSPARGALRGGHRAGRKGDRAQAREGRAPLGYFLLADLYNRIGDEARSAEYARKGQRRGRARK